jgi:GNAT superfamily N-acetyltransferase
MLREAHGRERVTAVQATTIREAVPADESRWLELWAGYNAFYGANVPGSITAQTWRRLLDPASTMFCRVAEWDGRVVGIANCVLHDGTWTSGLSCYLEDLFVDAELRRRGIATRLIDHLLSVTVEKGWSRFYWHTMATNPARGLYDRYTQADSYVRYRLSHRQATTLLRREAS